MSRPNDPLSRLLGLARRAGRLVWGMDAVLTALAQSRVELILLATDAAPATIRKLKLACAKQPHVVCRSWGTTQELATFSGKERTAILAVCDENFAAGIIKQLP